MITEGGSYTLPDTVPGESSTLNQLGNVGLQLTSNGEAAFLGDGSVLLGKNGDVRAAVVPTPQGQVDQAIIDGRTRSVKMLDVHDLIVGPDDTIYFEAEAEIREVGLLGEYKNYVWRVKEGEEPEAILAGGTLAADDGAMFSGEFVLKDANADGSLVLTAKLDRTQPQVSRSNDDTLVVIDDDGFPIVVARQGDQIPSLGGATYGVPNVQRDGAISQSGALVFRSGVPFSNDPLETELGAVLLAHICRNVCFCLERRVRRRQLAFELSRFELVRRRNSQSGKTMAR